MWCALSVPSTADIVVGVEPPFSDPPFAITSGHTVDYSPGDSINLTLPSGFPPPNTDAESDNRFGVSLNYGGTGVTVLTSRHIYEDSPEIALTVGNLDVNEPYRVYVSTFVNTGYDFYGGRYGLSSGALTSFFQSSGGAVVATGDWGPGFQGQFQVREFFLARPIVTNGEITLFIDDFDGASLVGNFAGLRLVRVPEPSGLLLAAVACFGTATVLWFQRSSKAK
jgi:hypothetical protein